MRTTFALILMLGSLLAGAAAVSADDLAAGFAAPPASARPWVYWFWMDGNLTREGITADLEAMRDAGLGGVIIMEVDVGIPRGPVAFMSPAWRELFKHVAAEADRLGIEVNLNASPGWTGSGGPWVRPEQSMQRVVFSETSVEGSRHFADALPRPPVKENFYQDIAVLAFPEPSGTYRIPGIREKALDARGHFSSEGRVPDFLPAPPPGPEPPPGQAVAPDRIVDLTGRMGADGSLDWQVPDGRWTVIRFGRTSTGANTRPAPRPGLGLECDKLDAAALEAHLDAYLGTLLRDIGPLAGRSLTMIHIDSWEVGTQNWTAAFRREFRRRRGYDPVPWLPALTGRAVGSREVSERFLWDLRQTVQDLIVEQYARRMADWAHRRGLRLSIEPYDGTPCDDLALGACADIPMGEFWWSGFDTTYSCTEASSIAHVHGKRIVAAESFTSGDLERWQAHPASLKTLGDWAFCEGINRFVFHRYQHQPWLDRRPGMTMGPYGIHYERTQTWWDHVPAFHAYLSRCQFLLQRGIPVADVLFLSPEGAPHVFRPPASARPGDPPDRPGHNFDACSPEALLERVSVKDGRLVVSDTLFSGRAATGATLNLILPDGLSYRLLVLPDVGVMTPRLLGKVRELVEAGATVVGSPPRRSPSLSDHPGCDDEVKRLAGELWGGGDPPGGILQRPVGKGRVVWGGGLEVSKSPPPDLPSPLARARWIWHAEGEASPPQPAQPPDSQGRSPPKPPAKAGNPAADAPAATRYFRRTFTLDAGAAVESARIVMTGDNFFELWVNGRPAEGGGAFTQAYTFDVAPLLRPGANLLAASVTNAGDGPNPAGLIGTLTVRLRVGRTVEVHTDAEWRTSAAPVEGWRTDPAAGGAWGAAMDLGPLGLAPWGEVGKPYARPEIYPDYGRIVRVLEAMGIPPDFESDAPLRFIHRRDGDTDLFFVANGGDAWIAARCAFRVSGRVPELWDPKTGRIRKAWMFEERGARTVLPLWLEPAGSVFVVFRPPPEGGKTDPVVAASRDGRSLLPEPGRPLAEPPAFEIRDDGRGGPGLLARESGIYELRTASGRTIRFEATLPPPLEVRGPWEVRFAPGLGAPASITLDAPTDWSRHADPGVRHFSGMAVYRATFDIPADLTAEGRRLEIDLGEVRVSAAVRVNGRDAGILWKPPFRVDVTDAIRGGRNELEIRVANLWPNRLIGDAGLPPEKRIAWTTWNPFTPNTPLLPSGLLGPVRLVPHRVVAPGTR